MMRKLAVLCCISLLLLFSASCKGSEEITIERINDRELQLCFENLNSKKMYSLNFKKEDIIVLEIEKEEGSIDIVIYDQNENEIYRGNGNLVKKFTIDIKNDGKYRIEIDGNRAKGSLKFLIT